uniref:Fatty acid binding protein 10b, liver basic n=1 Tax=Gadus morhua TaxID=8049 RepID=A0A8C5CI55_GADMO
MDYNGTWKVYFDDNLEGFLKAMSVPEMMIKMSKDVKPVTVIKQNGPDFTIEVKTPVRTNVNSFSLGKETEITAMDGRKFKCTVREEEGKLVFETDKFTSVLKTKLGFLNRKRKVKQKKKVILSGLIFPRLLLCKGLDYALETI